MNHGPNAQVVDIQLEWRYQPMVLQVIAMQGTLVLRQ